MSKIESICKAIQTEAQTVLSSTENIEGLLRLGLGETADLLDEIRIDSVTHLQKLTLELAKCFYEEQKKAETESPEETSEEKEEV